MGPFKRHDKILNDVFDSVNNAIKVIFKRHDHVLNLVHDPSLHALRVNIISGSFGGSGSMATWDGVYQTPTGYTTGGSFQDWVDLHFPAMNPHVYISANPSFGLREWGDDVVNPIISGRGTLGSNPSGLLTLLEFWRGNTSGMKLLPDDTNPATNTWYNHTDTFTISTNQQYTVRVTDSEGRIAVTSSSYIFVWPWYATSINITTLTKQSLQNGGNYYQVTAVAETDTDKHKTDFESNETITGIQFYNTVAGTWDWLNGNKVASLTVFSTSNVTHTVQGAVINYTRYTHNDAKVGERQLRFWIT